MQEARKERRILVKSSYTHDSEVEPAGAVPELHDDDGAHGEEEELQRQHLDPPFPLQNPKSLGELKKSTGEPLAREVVVVTYVADPMAPALVGEHGAEHARAVLEVLVEGDLHACARTASFSSRPNPHIHGRTLSQRLL